MISKSTMPKPIFKMLNISPMERKVTTQNKNEVYRPSTRAWSKLRIDFWLYHGNPIMAGSRVYGAAYRLGLSLQKFHSHIF